MGRRIRAVAVLFLLAVPGCGAGLSPSSSSDLGSTLANGALLGVGALAGSRSRTVERPIVVADQEPGRRRMREFVCSVDGQEQTRRGPSRAMTERRCARTHAECVCAERAMTRE
jgi:hypothetical protein